MTAKIILSQKDKEKPEGYRTYYIGGIPRASIEISANYKGDGSRTPIGGKVDVYVDSGFEASLSKDNFSSYKAAINYGQRIAKKLSDIKFRKKYANVWTRHYRPPH